MDCAERKDLILTYAAGALDAAESVELRKHLAGGCPQCAGYLAEAEATLAMLAFCPESRNVPANLKSAILARAGQSQPMRIGGWDRMILPAAIAAVLAVAITLLAVNQLHPTNPSSAVDQAKISDLQIQLTLANAEVAQAQQSLLAVNQTHPSTQEWATDLAKIKDLQNQLTSTTWQLADARKSMEGMGFAELTGTAQPGAVGHVFIDQKMSKWYFFTCGMKPAPDGKTYELWMICDKQKIPAGTFEVTDGGTATLLGAVPTLPAGASVTVAVTDEPSAGPHQSPTGNLQIKGLLE